MTGLDPSDAQLTRRLGDALKAEARQHPLAADFAASVSEELPDRTPRSRWSLTGAPAVAATVVLAIAAVALVVAISPRLIGPAPGSSVAPSASNESSPAGDLAHYDHDGISFDYPAEWRVIEEGINARHYQWIPVVIGTGDWTLNCQTIPPSGDSLGGITCGQDIFTVGAGEIVVEIYTWQGPGGPIQTPPPSAVQLASGWPATREDGADTSVWQIYLPGWLKPLTVEAHFDAAMVDSARADVEALVEGFGVSQDLLPASSTSPSPSPSHSPTAQASGYFVRWQNDDDASYHVELIEYGPPEDPAGQTYHPWTIGPGETGVVEVPSIFAGELQVRLTSCDAVAQWVVEPGNYEVVIHGGQATLGAVAARSGLVPMPTASTCIFNGP